VEAEFSERVGLSDDLAVSQVFRLLVLEDKVSRNSLLSLEQQFAQLGFASDCIVKDKECLELVGSEN